MSELTDLKGKKVLVLGLGRSGVASARKLLELGAKVSASDYRVSLRFDKKVQRLIKSGLQAELGQHSLQILQGQKLIIVSPGIPNDIPLLQEARRRKIPIWSEIELAYRLTSSPIIGITGTNGKTTTTSLVGEIFKEASLRVKTAGNIGPPLTEVIDGGGEDQILVAEVSSFQLENIVSFHPRIAVLLNISPDHLDRHHSLAQYCQAKARLFENQESNDWAIINYDDENCWSLRSGLKAKALPFSRKTELKEGIFVHNGNIKARIPGYEKEVEVCSLGEIQLMGDHNLENVLAAVAISLIWGVSPEVIRKTLRTFEGLKHRLEYVTTVKGVKFYNDSKATNPGATLKTVESFTEPLILLAGGRNKGLDMGALSRVSDRIKAAILFGESAGEIEKALDSRAKERPLIRQVSSLEEGVKVSLSIAEAGDVVVLSPACASFDMFENYKERGEAFKKAVFELKKIANQLKPSDRETLQKEVG